MYQDQQFRSRKALAKHLAPLLGRSVAALEVALRRHSDNIERVVGGLVQPSSGKAIPIVYQGQQVPNRAALARHLAPLVGKTGSTLITLLSRYDGDVERAIAPDASQGIERAEAIKGVATMTTRRHWRSGGTAPLPSGAEAMGEPFSAFPSWFLRITAIAAARCRWSTRRTPGGGIAACATSSPGCATTAAAAGQGRVCNRDGSRLRVLLQHIRARCYSRSNMTILQSVSPRFSPECDAMAGCTKARPTLVA